MRHRIRIGGSSGEEHGGAWSFDHAWPAGAGPLPRRAVTAFDRGSPHPSSEPDGPGYPPQADGRSQVPPAVVLRGGPVPTGERSSRHRGARSPTRRRWLWLPVLVVGVALVWAVETTLALTGNPNLVPSLLLLGALVVPVAFVAYIDGRNPAFDVPLLGLLLCGGIGGVLGVVTAALGEADVVLHLGAEPTLAVGVIEEAAKLLVPLAVLLFTRYRNVPADGLLVGVAAGVGFAVLETMGYGFTVLLETRDLAAVNTTLLIRGLTSPAGHAAWTGLAAAALWRVWAHRGRPAALLGLVGTFVLVVVLHTAWDTLQNPIAYLVIGVISLFLLLRQTRHDLDLHLAPRRGAA